LPFIPPPARKLKPYAELDGILPCLTRRKWRQFHPCCPRGRGGQSVHLRKPKGQL